METVCVCSGEVGFWAAGGGVMAELWQVEYCVRSAGGEDADWLSDRAAAIALARTLGGSVICIKRYADDRETIFDAYDDEEDEE